MISCDVLSRSFAASGEETRFAVEAVSFEIAEGTICALLGANGAGKSTLLKMLTGLLRPTSGSAVVAGFRVTDSLPEFKKTIGVVPENLALFDMLSIAEHLELSGSVYGLSKRDIAQRGEQLLEILALAEDRKRLLSQCSYGMRKKTALALALLHNPRVLFLDEPFEGIDPVTSQTIRDLLTTLAARGVTMLLTSHILALVERVAGQLLILKGGRLVWNSTQTSLPGPVEDLYFELAETPRTHSLEWLGSR